MNTSSAQLLDEVADLLKSGISEVFSTMLNLSVRVVEPGFVHGGSETYVAASVGFVGDVEGLVYLYIPESFARALACRLLDSVELGVDWAEMTGDAIGELSNMIVGATKSRLCDAGMACTLTIPSITRVQSVRLQPAGSLRSQLVTMACEGELVLLELTMTCPALPA